MLDHEPLELNDLNIGQAFNIPGSDFDFSTKWPEIFHMYKFMFASALAAGW